MDLIRVTEKEGKKVVSARDLHAFLEAGSNVNTWFKNQSERAMLVENEDFIRFQISETSGQTSFDYAITLSSAKEIAMLNGGEKGKQARTYFIECERKLKEVYKVPTTFKEVFKVPTTFKEALLLAAEQQDVIEQQQKQLIEQAPKVEFYDDVADTTKSFDMQEASAMLKLKYGRNKLFGKLRDADILMNDNLPYREYINKGLFVVVESKWTNSKTQMVNAVFQTRITQKGLDWLNKNKTKLNL